VKQTNFPVKTFYPHFSRWLCALLLFIYGGGFFCLWVAAIFIEIKLMVSVILIINFIMVARQHLWLTANKSIVAIGIDQQQWNFCVKSGANFQAMVMSNSIVTRYIIILKLKVRLTNRRFTLLLLPDSLTFDELRQLRTQLLK
jgi:hypothetical protein